LHRRQRDEAGIQFHKALQINPDLAVAHYNLGSVLVGRGELDEAVTQFQRTVELAPDYAPASSNLRDARSQLETIRNTLSRRQALLRSRPNDVALLNDTAWMLATNPNTSIRNGAEAMGLACRAVQLSGGGDPAILGTLAAAYAEAGRFSEAAETARKAAELAARQDKPSMAESLKAQIALYEVQKPFRKTP
jgi:tetratricopeptide (TPR) repeat protein